MNTAPIIKNRNKLETNDLRRQALDIIEAGIRRVLPDTIMQKALAFDHTTNKLSINHDIFQITGRLFVIGGGKASGLMAQELERIVGAAAIEDGLIIEKAGPEEFTTQRINVVQAGHPLPDSRGLAAVERMLRLKQKYSVGEKDTVICLISGGGSALMPYPLPGISLNDKQEVTRLLLSCGANIREINAVRKHLSAIKGGRLAERFAPARVISLVLSDVIGNDLSVISSGPTYPDPSTYSDAIEVSKEVLSYQFYTAKCYIYLRAGS